MERGRARSPGASNNRGGGARRRCRLASFTLTANLRSSARGGPTLRQSALNWHLCPRTGLTLVRSARHGDPQCDPIGLPCSHGLAFKTRVGAAARTDPITADTGENRRTRSTRGAGEIRAANQDRTHVRRRCNARGAKPTSLDTALSSRVRSGARRAFGEALRLLLTQP